ncbi:MAG: hypothetical protein LBR85_03310 [Oscillospiraceae bacterium]|jgi:V/A-type H+-transporting ATPase subunit E|nr:hypothetical protein [Oscillospiraceae bacterium]
MGGIERIIERIAGDARAEGEGKLAAARERADAMRRVSALTAEAQRQETVRKGETAAADRYERLVGMAETEARKKLLAVKQELIEEAFSRVTDALAAQSEEEKVAFLSALAAEGAVSGSEELVLTPADHTRFGKKVLENALAALKKAGKPAELRLSSSPRALEGGGGIVLRDGDIEINCSYGALVSAVKDDLTPEIAKILFA